MTPRAITVVGPAHPIRGGIAHHTVGLSRALAMRGHTVRLRSFRRLYPRILYPGSTDPDPSDVAITYPATHDIDALDPSSWFSTARSVLDGDPDVVVIQWWVTWLAPLSFLIARAARAAGVPVVFLCHNVLPHEPRPWDRPLARWALSRAASCVVFSAGQEAVMRSLVPGVSTTVAPLGPFDRLPAPTSSREAARGQLAIALDRAVLLFFGFVREYKGLVHLIDALPAIRRSVPAVQLMVVGEFWQDRRIYEQRIQALEVGDLVRLVDRYVKNEEVAMYFAAADLVVLPYIDATQSAVVQTAFAFGAPLVTTSVGGLAESVRHDVEGLVVPPGDSAALASAVERFFLEPGCAQRLRAGALARGRTTGWDELIAAVEAQAR